MISVDRYQAIIKKLNDFMLGYSRSGRMILDIAVNDLINGGGKRLRPLLLLLSAEFGDGDKDKLLPMAAGVEFLHMATLIHDDIIDEAELRRGKMTAQEKFGKNAAVFVGDFLLTKAYSLFADYLSRESLLKLNKVVSLICIGEIDQFEGKYNTDLSVNDYLKRIRRKTALLFALCSYIGAYETGVRGRDLYNLYKFALELGMSFQIQDDLLDFTGNKIKIGKEADQDLITGIYTLPIILLLKKDNYKERASYLLSKEYLGEKEISEIKELLLESGTLLDSRNIAEKFLGRAEKYLERLPENRAKEELRYILNCQLTRKK